jgi:hypothetical protein
MPYYKFGSNDILYNQLKTHPQSNFIIYNNQLFYNNKGNTTGSHTSNVTLVPSGYISLYELNIDRKSDNLIYPYVTKDGSLTSFSTVGTSKFNSDFAYGERITGSYPLSASITSTRYAEGASRPKINALRNALNSYEILSYDYSYSSSLGDKSSQELRLISIPSIFYGSSIQKGTVSLKFYVSGTEVAELKDNTRNGQLKQVASGSGADAGTVGGIVMYNEGFIILTGSWGLASHTENYTGDGAAAPRWIDFATMRSGVTGSSFALNFSGTHYVPTMTMFAAAGKGELNHSNNPTYKKYDAQTNFTNYISGGASFRESESSIVNVVSSSFSDTQATFQKTTFINYVGIYDESKNLIAIAKMANPVRKRENDNITFKLKVDF